MARGPKPLTMYPVVFLEVAHRAHQGLDVPPWKMEDEKAAIGTRHHFNRFRRALAEQMHPHAEASSDLILRLQQDQQGWWIVFVKRGLYQPGQEQITISDLIVPGIDPVIAPSASQDIDHTERYLENWLKQGRAPAASLPAASLAPEASGSVDTPAQDAPAQEQECQHEADVTGARCLKCNIPLG